MKRACCLIVAVICASVMLSAQANSAPVRLKDEMRQPWQPNATGFLRHWLILGEFPNVKRAGMDVDYLTEHGGETNIRPVAGMTHKRPDGSDAMWKDHMSDNDSIDLLRFFGGNSTDVVAYAYTTLERAAAGKALLLLGSDDGVTVWVNGKQVHRNLATRGVTADEDQVEVTLNAGANRVLLKVDQGTGGWGFIFRVADPAAFAGPAAPLQTWVERRGNLLSIGSNAAEGHPVDFEVMAAGGRIVARRTAARGAKVSIDVSTWPDGAYEVRASTQDALGKTTYSYAAWYKGDLLTALKELVAKAPMGRAPTPEAGHHQMLAEMVKDRMQGNMDSLEGKPVGVLQSILLEHAELKQQSRSAPPSPSSRDSSKVPAGAGPVHASGFVRLAYIDDLDGSTQFCRAYLPAQYDASRKWPMVISLHGYNGDNPVYVRWWSVDVRHNALADNHDVIFVEPHGRGNTSYQGMGERDVMRCVQLAKERFRVDDDRVYLTGYSMGGGGTWYVGSRHPEVFAAIAPVFGGWDYHVDMSEEQLAKLTPRERNLQEMRSGLAQADALLNTPIFVNHGDADPTVSVENSRYIVRMLQRWGYNVRYREHPGKGHGGLGNDDEIIEWLRQQKRTLYPRQVRVRAAELSSAAAFWVRINQREDERDFMRAQAELVGPNAIRLDTNNALSVTLSPGRPLIDPAKPLRVYWNGAAARTLTLKDGSVTLMAEAYVPAKLEKTAQIAGPVSHVATTPYAVITGTIAEDAMTRELCRRTAQKMADSWMSWQHQPVRLFKDTEISEADLSRYSLILIGGSEANAVTRNLAGSLPLKIAGTEITIDGRTFHAPDAAVRIVYPHPLNPARYVLLMAATSPAGMYFAPQPGDDLSDYDFVITDGVVPSSLRGRTPDKTRIAAGWFDRRWHIADSLLEQADPLARAGAPVVKVRPDLTTFVSGGLELNPEVLDSYVGMYEGGHGVRFELKRDGTGLVLHLPNQAMPLVATSDTEFEIAGEEAALIFVRDAQGKMTHAVLKPVLYPAVELRKTR